jgi:hypothetical protein
MNTMTVHFSGISSSAGSGNTEGVVLLIGGLLWERRLGSLIELASYRINVQPSEFEPAVRFPWQRRYLS